MDKETGSLEHLLINYILIQIIKRDDKKGLVNLARDLEECDLTFRQLNLHSRIDNFDAVGKIV